MTFKQYFDKKLLMESQLDAVYLRAVEEGDDATVAQMLVDAASKAGYRVGPVYHHGSFNIKEHDVPEIGEGGMHFGTEDAARQRAYGKIVDDHILDITIDQDEETGRYHWSMQGLDSYDYNDEEFETEWEARQDAEQTASDMGENEQADASELGEFTKVYLKLENPLTTRDFKDDWTKIIAKAKASGYDAIIYKNEFEDRGSESIIVFYPYQIKSAEATEDERGRIIPLSERFNSQNPSILY